MLALRCVVVVLFLTTTARAADVFDRHTTKDLQRVLEQGPAAAQLTLNEAAKLKPLSATLSSPCIVVKTDEGNYAKALVGWGLRKGGEKPTPVLLIERFVTYRGDRPELTAALGKDVMLFPGFTFNFDIGQVVPAGQGADIEYTAESALKPLGETRMVPLHGSQLPAAEATAKRDPAATEGVKLDDFAGSWQIDADGRWKGEWELRVTDTGDLRGTFVSDESKNRYDVTGEGGALPHQAKLEVFLANAQMQIDAYLWTKDKSRMAGTLTLAGRKFGFVATRVETE
jgi:hypothetical protein